MNPETRIYISNAMIKLYCVERTYRARQAFADRATLIATVLAQVLPSAEVSFVDTTDGKTFLEIDFGKADRESIRAALTVIASVEPVASSPAALSN